MRHLSFAVVIGLSQYACSDQGNITNAYANSLDNLKSSNIDTPAQVANTQRLIDRHVKMFIEVKKRENQLKQRLAVQETPNKTLAPAITAIADIANATQSLEVEAANHLNFDVIEYQRVKNTLQKVTSNAMIRGISVNNETLARQEAALAKISVSRLNEKDPLAKAQYDKIIDEFTQRLEQGKHQFEETVTERSIQEHNVALLKRYRHKLKSLDNDPDAWSYLFQN